MAKRRRKWCIVIGDKYVGENGTLKWTYDLKEATETANNFGGQVVDGNWLRKNWPITGEIPAEAKPPVAVVV